jgi:hypothetical protein
MVDTGLNLVQRSGNSEELTLIGGRGEDDTAAGLRKELVESIGLISEDELVLSTVDGKLAKGQLALEVSGQALDLGTSLLCGSALSGNKNVLLGTRHELHVARVGFLGRWLGGPCIVAGNVDLGLRALLDLAQLRIVCTSNEGEELGRDGLQPQTHVGAPFLDNRLNLAARHLRRHSITLNQDINGIIVVLLERGTVVIGAGNLHTGTSAGLNILNN